MSLKNPRDRIKFKDDLDDVRDIFDSFSDHHSKGGRRRLIGLVLILCAALAVLVAADYWMNYGKIFQGVEVGGVSLGGKSTEEARASLEEHIADGGLEKIRLGSGSEEFALSADRLRVDFDVRATVEQAYAVGRQGGILERLGDRLQAAWGTVSVPATVNYDQKVARTDIENLAAQINENPRNAYVTVRGSNAVVTESREGYGIDVETTLANVERALQGMSGEAELAGGTLVPEVLTPAAEEAAKQAEEAMSEPVVLNASRDRWKLSPSEIGQTLSFTPEGGELRVGLDQERLRDALSEVYNDLEAEPVEAGFEFQESEDGTEISVTKSRDGKEIEEEKLFGEMETGLFEGVREYEVPLVTIEPELTTEEAEKLKPTRLLGSYRTNYTLSSDKSPERVENLAIASNAISGRAVAPGEIFSVNEVLAPLEYNETKVIILGKEEKADGGGLCQVSSTLYMAANYAGLEIVERHPHDAQLPYIRPGLDATVWFGALDMKFKNTTEGYILLREYVANDGFIYAEIWGRPTGKTVEMDSEPLYLGSDYSEWVTYQKVTENGKVVFDDAIRKDTYKPLVDDKGKTIAPNSEELNIAPVNY